MTDHRQNELPDPPVSPDCDCTDLDGFMLNVERLMGSELVALSSHEVLERRCSYGAEPGSRGRPRACRTTSGCWLPTPACPCRASASSARRPCAAS